MAGTVDEWMSYENNYNILKSLHILTINKKPFVSLYKNSTDWSPTINL